MDINKKSESQYLIYEEGELGILVAIHKSDQTIIKKYWKSKGERDLSASIAGHPFVHDEEQDSLKIDFNQEQQYLITNLKKFN